MTAPRVAHCVFCDDIRLELGNKMSYMGVYSGGDLLINQPFPVGLAKFCILTWLISDPDDRPTTISLQVVGPDGQMLMKADTPSGEMPDPFGLKETAEKAIFTHSLQCTPLWLACKGTLEVWIETEREKIRAGRLLIHSSVETPESSSSPLSIE